MNRSVGGDEDWCGAIADRPFISVIIPTLNERTGILGAIRSAADPEVLEVFVVDGGSTDDTGAIAEQAGAKVLHGGRGRAVQMNLGAGAASGDLLLFLHGDSVLPSGFGAVLRREFQRSRPLWGRFDVHLAGHAIGLRMVEVLMNLRSRWTRIATGDQAIFVRREWFSRSGGFASQPLMEDIEFSGRAKRAGPMLALAGPVVTSARRWEKNGFLRTILLMWCLRAAYWEGIPLRWLAVVYSRGR